MQKMLLIATYAIVPMVAILFGLLIWNVVASRKLNRSAGHLIINLVLAVIYVDFIHESATRIFADGTVLDVYMLVMSLFGGIILATILHVMEARRIKKERK